MVHVTPVVANFPSTVQGKIVIFPSVSFGNLDQLALDVLISTLALRKLAILSSTCDAVLPVVGCNAYGSDVADVNSSIEVYGNDMLVAVQIRAPVVASRASSFARELMALINTWLPLRIIVVAGLNAGYRIDRQLTDHPGIVIRGLHHQNRKDIAVLEDDTATEVWEHALVMQTVMQEHLSDRVAGIVAFCSEGQNANDALHLAAGVCLELGISIPQKWKLPASWRFLPMQAPRNSSDAWQDSIHRHDGEDSEDRKRAAALPPAVRSIF